MRFGIEFGSYPGDLDPVEVCEQVTLRAEVAQKNNFEGLFVAQHYLTGPEAAILQSIPLLSYLAGRVPGMYLGTSIFLLPLHHPLMVAEYLSTLDNLSGGKVLFGVGQGYREKEFYSFGIDRRERRGRLVEGLEVIRRLWSEEAVTFHGKYFHLEKATCLPRPRQRPRPPILLGADSVQTVARVPEVADHWIARRRRFTKRPWKNREENSRACSSFAISASPTRRAKPRSASARATSGAICAISSGASRASVTISSSRNCGATG